MTYQMRYEKTWESSIALVLSTSGRLKDMVPEV
jgi:hypothetical protein